MRRVIASVSAIVLAAGFAACGGSPSTPTPTPPPPPVVINTPPTIQSVTAGAVRVEADTEVQLTATVQDAETPVASLTYQWSSQPAAGTFTGSGAQVRWRAPKSVTTPDTYTLTLTVVENYTSQGQPKENRVSGSTQVRYNDSVAEISKIVGDFLTDFGTNSVTPEQVVRNFSDSCRGKAEELIDVQNNRRLFTILSAQYTIQSVTLNSDRTRADVVAPCTFRDIPKSTGVTETVRGTCLLTSVYESFRWWLCDSRFEHISTTIPLALQPSLLPYAHP